MRAREKGKWREDERKGYINIYTEEKRKKRRREGNIGRDGKKG